MQHYNSFRPQSKIVQVKVRKDMFLPYIQCSPGTSGHMKPPEPAHPPGHATAPEPAPEPAVPRAPAAAPSPAAAGAEAPVPLKAVNFYV